jgi:hypothetical protein
MPDSDTSLCVAAGVERVGDCTLVTVRVSGAGGRAVRVTNRLDGPVAPPRRAGVPERGWDERGFTGRLPSDGTLAVGYAVPAPPADPPVTVEPADDVPAADAPAAVVRRLGDPSPPTAAVEDGPPDPDDGATSGGTGEGARPSEGPSEHAADGRPTPDADGAGSEQSAERASASRTPAGTPASAEPPAAVTDWLDAVEARVDRAEALTDADVDAATAALADAGGVRAVASLPDALRRDEAALRRVRERTAALSDRATATAVPVEALRRLT